MSIGSNTNSRSHSEKEGKPISGRWLGDEVFSNRFCIRMSSINYISSPLTFHCRINSTHTHTHKNNLGGFSSNRGLKNLKEGEENKKIHHSDIRRLDNKALIFSHFFFYTSWIGRKMSENNNTQRQLFIHSTKVERSSNSSRRRKC